jgi:hypothetical protein
VTPAPAPRQREVAPSQSPKVLLEAIERVVARLHCEEGPPYDRATAAREVHELTEELHPADIAHILEGLPVEDRLWVWGLVGPEREGDVLLEVSDAVRDTLLADMDNAEIVAATQDLDADEIADLAPDLPDEVVQGIIEAQDVEDRAQLQTALSYPEGTVGSLMDFEVVSVRDDVDCEAALQYLRRFDELPGHTDAVFVVDRDGRLKGSLALNRLLVSNPDVEVSGSTTRRSSPSGRRATPTRRRRLSSATISSAPRSPTRWIASSGASPSTPSSGTCATSRRRRSSATRACAKRRTSSRACGRAPRTGDRGSR